MASKRSDPTTIHIGGSTADRRIILNALGDHVRAIESNCRRAQRGQTIAINQGDDDTAEAYVAVQTAADRRIRAARAVRERILQGSG